MSKALYSKNISESLYFLCYQDNQCCSGLVDELREYKKSIIDYSVQHFPLASH